MNQILGTCSVVYDLSISSLAKTPKAIQEKRVEDAASELTTAATGYSNCDYSFEEVGMESLLKVEDEEMLQLDSMALALTARLM
ncbi:hypothetical protein Cni_G28582 [Canna indica]|uniref:Pectinesterase inhibitor domain-containing protein n=1 Tax=Canna indica TaxID=4628 RepID=A0AAQ3L3M5_9LILI|nr:hypothetical protein Cni_G28582 [Canna indica]